MNKDELRESLRRLAVRISGGCSIQNNWPCGTCFCAGLEKLGLNSKSKEYKQHNRPVDRINEVWRAILQIREKN